MQGRIYLRPWTGMFAGVCPSANKTEKKLSVELGLLESGMTGLPKMYNCKQRSVFLLYLNRHRGIKENKFIKSRSIEQEVYLERFLKYHINHVFLQTWFLLLHKQNNVDASVICLNYPSFPYYTIKLYSREGSRCKQHHHSKHANEVSEVTRSYKFKKSLTASNRRVSVITLRRPRTQPHCQRMTLFMARAWWLDRPIPLLKVN